MEIFVPATDADRQYLLWCALELAKAIVRKQQGEKNGNVNV